MKKSINSWLLVLAGTLCFFCYPISSIQAALVFTDFTGTVTLDNSGNNPFGLLNGDAISGRAIYDDTGLSNEPDPGEQLFLDDFTGWDFRITLGSFSVTQSDVTDPTYTSFYFVENKLGGIEFILEDIDIGIFEGLLIEDFGAAQSLFAEDFETGDPIYLEATWDFENATNPRPVPIPGAAILLGSGIVGAVLLIKEKILWRRKQRHS
jgi:hypothetical protein